MTTPAEFVTALETFLAGNMGISEVKHPDGRTIKLDRVQAMKELSYWQSKTTTPTQTGNMFTRSRFKLSGDA